MILRGRVAVLRIRNGIFVLILLPEFHPENNKPEQCKNPFQLEFLSEKNGLKVAPQLKFCLVGMSLSSFQSFLLYLILACLTS